MQRRHSSWVDGEFQPYDAQESLHSDASKPHVPPIYELTHSYDRASNRLARYNETATLGWNHHHEQFDYDGLHRVAEARPRSLSAMARDRRGVHSSRSDEQDREHSRGNELFEQARPNTTELLTCLRFMCLPL